MQSQPIPFGDETRRLAEFFAGLTYDDFPEAVVSRIKMSLLDSIGCCIQGATLPWTQQVAKLAIAEDAAPVASMFGVKRKTSLALAALVNGTAGHAFELDDIHRESILHAGSLAVPVALAFAQKKEASNGKEVITAIAAGYELGLRVGNAATMALFFRGFHPQGTSGVFVAAATAAKILGLDGSMFQHAIGIAGSQAGGLMAAQEGAMVKRLHSGRAAQSGVYSALLAQEGFTGIPDVLEASYGGYLSTLSGEPNLGRLTNDLGREWEILQVGYKPHACVTSIHAALDGMAAIMKDNGLTADAIAMVEVGLSKMTHVHCAWQYKVQGVTAAQMNLFFCLALIAYEGKVFTAQFDSHRLGEPRLINFTQRITATIDSRIEAMGPSFRHAARVIVFDHNGRRYEKLVLHRRGSPEQPLNAVDIEEKFRNVVSQSLSGQQADQVIALVSKLEDQQNLDELCRLIF